MSGDFTAWLQELLAGLGSIRTRAMFGGHGVYASVDGGEERMVGVVIDDTLYLKTDAETVACFEAAGCAPFMYRRQGQEMPMSYWSLPAEAMDSAQAMLPWARLAWEAAVRKPKPKRRRAKRAAANGAVSKRKPSRRRPKND